jgi:hypothetical protein
VSCATTMEVTREEQNMGKYDADVQRIASEMKNTENDLIATGFSSEQWELIKKYIVFALALSLFSHANEG